MPLLRGKLIGDFTNRQAFSGDGSTVNFTWTYAPTSLDSISVHQNGLLLEYTTHYTVSGTTLTMASAPSLGTKINTVYQYKA
jgi:hypothetical protein